MEDSNASIERSRAKPSSLHQKVALRFIFKIKVVAFEKVDDDGTSRKCLGNF